MKKEKVLTDRELIESIWGTEINKQEAYFRSNKKCSTCRGRGYYMILLPQNAGSVLRYCPCTKLL